MVTRPQVAAQVAILERAAMAAVTITYWGRSVRAVAVQAVLGSEAAEQ
jgi:hypothetical protein